MKRTEETLKAPDRKEPRYKREYSESRMLYSAAGLGHLLDLSARTVKGWRKEGRIPEPAVVDGNFVRWTYEQAAEIVRGFVDKTQAA